MFKKLIFKRFLNKFSFCLKLDDIEHVFLITKTVIDLGWTSNFTEDVKCFVAHLLSWLMDDELNLASHILDFRGGIRWGQKIKIKLLG